MGRSVQREDLEDVLIDGFAQLSEDQQQVVLSFVERLVEVKELEVPTLPAFDMSQ